MQKSKLTPLFILILVIALVVPITVLASGQPYPDIIPLPDGFRPEGIAVGKGHTFYTGSLANGAIYRGDLRTGDGGILVAGQEERLAVGMNFDERSSNLFVAGGTSGEAYVYNGSTGEELALYTLGTGFINDVIVTRQAAYFTNSFAGEFYRLPLGPRGALPAQADVQTIPLSGDWVQDSGFNANGIEASANGKNLIIVNSGRGELYKVDPLSGHAVLIDLGGADVVTGDGLVRRGASLFVVQNRLNQIAEIALAPDWGSGEVVELLTHPSFDVPTTAATFGNALYAVNARFGTPPEPNTSYDAVRVPLN